ncbi:hypothetical protein TPB0596_35040 [Tsukamurella pulmonis]|uniref:Alkylhydroperoxidase AhpD family core domain-containing protein n=1 Tax=Tsukamurella pulmonis TaxID=47312 RepID=A0A1H1CWI7_9ACTN|nr:carboxymuconolactone decarboxylase family protein [Tsukamurella pulmonis]KXO89726.1 alkylhydroperoxidase [Tsukamurella pulmonis]KXP10977.1 alkylhydroperoxidase [Tsukamurella pulmonis]RDH12948.1 carboxymuconolactone decarboxylase family protein [Tsukamurella pulmonis]SDQ68510.1 alkylhydroperoxidase AhpD family core domain-containing protein [Tsukamurella pulmonis]SUP22945.1 Arsenate reductase and related proteins, glutaredoxin family [Tsukamurella pulmonis]
MSEIAYKNTRFDPEGHPFNEAAKPLAEAVGYTAELSVEPKLAELLRLRVSQVNGCAFCNILHGQSARDNQIPQAKIDGLTSYANSDLFTEAEKTALRYCDALTVPNTDDFDRFHQAMTEHFTIEQIKDVAAAVINMHLWTRWKLAQGQTPYYTDAPS